MRVPYLSTRSGAGKPWTRECNLRFDCRSIADDGTFEGYASVFGVLETSYGTQFAPGAFSASLAASKSAGTMPKMLWQHDWTQPIGVYTEMSEDKRGLLVQGQLILSVPQAKAAYDLLKARAIDGLSVGFVINSYEYDATDDVMTITEADLWEVSIVTFAANPEARVGNVRNAENIRTERDFERFLREEGGFSNNRAKAIASRGFRAADAHRDDGALDSGILEDLEALRRTFS